MAQASKPVAKVELHYGFKWSVFSMDDRHCERSLYWSRDEDLARKFARAWSAWVRRGCPLDATRPLTMNTDGTVFRQGDFDARLGGRLAA